MLIQRSAHPLKSTLRKTLCFYNQSVLLNTEFQTIEKPVLEFTNGLENVTSKP